MHRSTYRPDGFLLINYETIKQKCHRTPCLCAYRTRSLICHSTQKNSLLESQDMKLYMCTGNYIEFSPEIRTTVLSLAN